MLISQHINSITTAVLLQLRNYEIVYHGAASKAAV